MVSDASVQSRGRIAECSARIRVSIVLWHSGEVSQGFVQSSLRVPKMIQHDPTIYKVYIYMYIYIHIYDK